MAFSDKKSEMFPNWKPQCEIVFAIAAESITFFKKKLGYIDFILSLMFRAIVFSIRSVIEKINIDVNFTYLHLFGHDFHGE